MQPTDWSPPESGQRLLAVGLVLLFVGSMASVAAATPATTIGSAEVSETTVTVGENITVSAEALNVGDSGGGYTFNFESNASVCGTGYCEFEQIRVTIPADSDRRAETNVSFDEPGTYGIRVDGERAGTVRVRPSRARVEATTESQRRIDLRANGVASDEPTDFDVPPSNRSFAVRNWSTATGQSTFQQSLTEYTDRSGMPATVPSAEQATLVGVVGFESDDEVRESTMRVGVNDSLLAETALSRDGVAVYQRNGDTWERLSTSVVADRTDRAVYEATVTRGTTYAVGRIDPSFLIENTSVRISANEGGQLLTLDAQIGNTAPVAGEFTGSLRVNGEAVNTTTMTVPANGTANLSLSHEVTESGTYTVRLNRSQSTRVLLSESDIGAQPTESPGATASATSDDAGAVPGPVPSTLFGVRTLYVLGGVALALGVFVVILLLLRGGGDGGGGLQDDFDPW